MVLCFASHELLCQALLSEAISVAVQRQSAGAALDDHGRLWVQPAIPLSKSSLKALSGLGVDILLALPSSITKTVPCWHALVPLTRAPVTMSRVDCVLFEIPEASLPGLIAELNRLGNRRSAFRWLDNGRALLRVVAPPHYCVQRALEGDRASLIAYLERKPGLWVELGYQHPLLEQIETSPGQLLLLGAGGEWTFLEDRVLVDTSASQALVLPGQSPSWRESPPGDRISVPLRLARAAAADPAELWVLQAQSTDQLRQWVGHQDDALLSRLSFAVAHNTEAEVVVLRVQPARRPPPVLLVNAIGFRPYWKLPNLFVPCGSRLHPLLRRDVVRQALANDPHRIFWLLPKDNARFIVHSLAESAFQPLSQWIEYQRDSETPYGQNNQPSTKTVDKQTLASLATQNLGRRRQAMWWT